MIDTNTIILEFISKNWIAILILLNLLQGIAWLTPSVKDDKIVTLISNTFDTIRNFRSGNKENKKPEVSPYEYTDEQK